MTNPGEKKQRNALTGDAKRRSLSPRGKAEIGRRQKKETGFQRNLGWRAGSRMPGRHATIKLHVRKRESYFRSDALDRGEDGEADLTRW